MSTTIGRTSVPPSAADRSGRRHGAHYTAFDWQMPAVAAAVPAVREAVRWATSPLDRSLAETAALLTSEIMTAALLRGQRDDIGVLLMLTHGELHVEGAIRLSGLFEDCSSAGQAGITTRPDAA